MTRRRDRPRRLPLEVPAAEAAGLAKATQRFRCSVDSEARDEPLNATASTVSAFLLLVLPATAGLVLSALLLAILGSAKAFGLAAVFVALGRRLTREATRGSPFFGDPAA